MRDLRGCLCTALGKTPDEVGALPFPQVLDLMEYWNRFPPAHILMRNAWFKIPQERESFERQAGPVPARLQAIDARTQAAIEESKRRRPPEKAPDYVRELMRESKLRERRQKNQEAQDNG